MNIRIDDDVPLPQPDKVDTWQTGPHKPIRSTDPELDAALTKDAAYIEAMGGDSGPTLDDIWVSAPPVKLPPAETYVQTYGRAKRPEPKPERYPAETTYDAKSVPTTDCFLVGGPLNGRHGPIVGTARVVELEVYAADGSVASVELYELGDRGDLGGRYWAGTKAV